ncbi:hypothetical protein M8494_03075 [Serratia ureilytica]
MRGSLPENNLRLRFRNLLLYDCQIFWQQPTKFLIFPRAPFALLHAWRISDNSALCVRSRGIDFILRE